MAQTIQIDYPGPMDQRCTAILSRPVILIKKVPFHTVRKVIQRNLREYAVAIVESERHPRVNLEIYTTVNRLRVDDV